MNNLPNILPSESESLNLQIYEYEVSNAFQRDCEKLLLIYECLEDLTFKSFAKIWRDMSFSLVYGDVEHAADIRLLTEAYFLTAKKFLLFPRSVYTQVGALYLLYGLYYKQPFKAWIKIRLTHDEYRTVLDFVQNMKRQDLQEPEFIFTKLKLENAFAYVGVAMRQGVENSFAKQNISTQNDTFEVLDTEILNERLDKLVNDNLRELNDIDEKYKSAMKEYKDSNPSANLAIFQSNLGGYIESKCPTPSQSNSNSIAQSRNAVRKKAVGTKLQPPRLRSSVAQLQTKDKTLD